MLTYRIIRDVRSMFRDVNVREEFYVNMCIILNDYRERERERERERDSSLNL
jgi:hypothetical protein